MGIKMKSIMKPIQLITAAFLTCMAAGSNAQSDSLATVHFYYTADEQSGAGPLEIVQGEAVLAEIGEGKEVLMNTLPGRRAFGLRPGKGSLTLLLQPGVTVYVLCTSEGTMIRRTQSEAEGDLKKLRGN
jgi:hypothetical protein